MKVSEFITEFRVDINDTEGLGVTDEWIIEAINDARCEVFSLHPSRFTKNQIVKATVGDLQCVDHCCSKLVSVESITDSRGRYLGSVSVGDVTQAKKFDKASAKPKSVSRSYESSPTTPRQFTVNPPIKPSEDIYFRIVCYSKPDPVTSIDDEMPDDCLHSSVLLYVKYRFFSNETESISSINRSSSFLEQFYLSLSNRRLIDLKIKENKEE